MVTHHIIPNAITNLPTGPLTPLLSYNYNFHHPHSKPHFVSLYFLFCFSSTLGNNVCVSSATFPTCLSEHLAEPNQVRFELHVAICFILFQTLAVKIQIILLWSSRPCPFVTSHEHFLFCFVLKKQLLTRDFCTALQLLKDALYMSVIS